MALLFLVTALAANAQTALLLKNGDRVSGKIISEDATNVTIATAWGKQTLPLTLIEKRLDLPDASSTNKASVAAATNAPAATPAKAPVAQSKTPAVSATNAPAATAKAATPSKAAPASTPKPVAAKKPKLWNFEVQVGANLQVNQVETETYTGLFRANYLGPLVRHNIAYNGSYGRTEGVVSRNRMDGSVRTEYDFAKNKRSFVFNAGGAGYDAIRKVDLIYDESFGIGYKFLQAPKFSATGDIGLTYQWQYFSDNTEKEYLSLRVGETFGWSITPRLGMDQKAEFAPHLTEFGGYRLRLEVNTTYKLNQAGNIYLNFSVIDTYDTTRARRVTPNDLLVRSTIGLKF